MKNNRVGKLGEIYKDPDTGVTYECTSIYRDSTGNAEYTWKVVDTVEVEDEFQIEPDDNPSDEFQTKLENESQKIPEGKISENVSENAESKPNNKEFKSHSNYNPRYNKTKYTNYSKK